MKQALCQILQELGHKADAAAVKMRHGRSRDEFYNDVEASLEGWLYDQLLTLDSSIGFYGRTIIEGNQDNRWITTLWSGSNAFYTGAPLWSVHFGLETASGDQIGCLYMPKVNNLFYAETGKGVEKNGVPVCIDQDIAFKDATGGIGFSCVRGQWEENCIPIFSKILPDVAFMAVLPVGSSAGMIVDNCYQFMVEKNLTLNQIYAAAVIVKEAGGIVSNFKGEDILDPSNIVFCGNQKVYKELLPYLKSTNTST